MAMKRSGWSMPIAPTCCNADMSPIVPCEMNSPLFWQCESCKRRELAPAIEWPFIELRATNAELEALGFVIEVGLTSHTPYGYTQEGPRSRPSP
jgi:hypothetical protein